MKAIKLTAIAAAAVLSTSAMANVVTDTASNVATGTVNAVKNTGAAIFDGGRTLVKTAVKPAAVSVEAGTLGYGANIAWAANENTSIVAGWTGGDITDLVGDDFTARGVDYTVDTDMSNPYVGVQVRPMSNWLTVNGGIIIPDNDIDVKASGKGSFKVGGEVYNYNSAVNGELKGKLEHRNQIAPYLTVGFRPTINNNWGVFGEVGAAYMGDTRADITATSPDSVVTSDNGTTKTMSQLANQASADIEDKNWGRWAPIAKVGVTYRF